MGSDRGNYRRTILELVLVTAIFAVVSVFILKIYLTADRLQADAVAISTATVQSESIAETVKLLGVEGTAARFGMEAGEGYYILRYDKNWGSTSGEEKYQIILVPKETEHGLERAVVYAGTAELESRIRQEQDMEDVLLCRLFVARQAGAMAPTHRFWKLLKPGAVRFAYQKGERGGRA